MTAKFSAKALFQTKDRTGQSEVADTVLNTAHQNQVGQDRKVEQYILPLQSENLLSQICCIQIQKGDKNRADRVSTTGGDGKMIIWDLRTLERKIQGLKL